MADDPVALVTGANKGLGKEIARQLGRRGATVLLGSRDHERGVAAAADLRGDGVHVVPVRIDVTDPTSVEATAERLRADHGRLDILVNNAGITVEERAVALTAEQVRQIFEVNVFGVVTVVNTLLPLLRVSTSPRIVNVSSTTASLTLTSGGTDFGGDADLRVAYSSSKAALNMLTVQYAKTFAQDPALARIRINAATPGRTATDMTHHRGRSVADGARAIVELATLPDGGPTGGFYNDQGVVPW